MSRTKKALKYYYIKIKRAKGTPHSVALGIGIGLFCGVFIPTFQMILAFILALIFKANKPMALIFTFVSNPWTVPFLYPALCVFGAKVLGIHLTIDEIKISITSIFTSGSFSMIGHLGWDLLLSFMVGGAILGAVIGCIGYFISKKLLIRYKKKKERKRKQLANSIEK